MLCIEHGLMHLQTVLCPEEMVGEWPIPLTLVLCSVLFVRSGALKSCK